MEEEQRLQKYIASCGICSRRKAEQLILDGKVKVNDLIVKELGTKVSANDKVMVDDLELKKEKLVYYLLNKPLDYVCTNEDRFAKKKAVDLIKSPFRLVSAGRLDKDTTGAIIFSNDGDFINKIIHPSKEISKTYIAKLKNEPNDMQIKKLENGVKIDESYITKKAKVRKINKTSLEIVIHEGKNRQVRKMLKSVGLELISLHRAKIGDISLDDLKKGEYRQLTLKEIQSFLEGK